MNKASVLSKVDHTILSPTATREDVERICQESITYQTASACIPPYYVKDMKEKFGDKLTITTVIGFPLGYMATAAKVAEAKQAVADGADEIDMVINVSAVKSKDFASVQSEIEQLKAAVGSHILKVIIETSYLTEEEKIEMCKIVSNAGADFIKTSTGFSNAGASLADIALFREYLSEGVKIKASGGIRSKEDFEAFVEAGVNRIGASSAISAFNGEAGKAGY
ncbi:deoxyribose-phosphate aldolase [uncultured Vagococcus sp.]|uniref:deoxyribose-phosphate aldolase n=1 Tax=uncultured Vagococcus sp. TaxID=189676 RepID=UPI0028D1FA6B|nr:deoxyribose-phosphate aldolase [uncultured Vagococcus sp.]